MMDWCNPKPPHNKHGDGHYSDTCGWCLEFGREGENAPYYSGDRVIVFDSLLTRTMCPATVIRWYGKRAGWRLSESFIKENNWNWTYPSLIDVRFDHCPDGISHGHFTDGVKHIEEEE